MEGVLKIKRVKQIPQKAPIYIGTCMQSSGKTDLKSNADFQKVGAVEEQREKMEVAKMSMFRWMCDHIRKDKMQMIVYEVILV